MTPKKVEIELSSDYVINKFVKWMKPQLPEDTVLNFSKGDLGDDWQVCSKKSHFLCRELHFYISTAYKLNLGYRIVICTYTDYGFIIAYQLAQKYKDADIKINRVR